MREARPWQTSTPSRDSGKVVPAAQGEDRGDWEVRAPLLSMNAIASGMLLQMCCFRLRRAAVRMSMPWMSVSGRLISYLIASWEIISRLHIQVA